MDPLGIIVLFLIAFFILICCLVSSRRSIKDKDKQISILKSREYSVADKERLVNQKEAEIIRSEKISLKRIEERESDSLRKISQREYEADKKIAESQKKILLQESQTAKKAEFYNKAVSEINSMVKEKCRSYPHMAAIMSDIQVYMYVEAEDYLKYKKRPAISEAIRISELREKTKGILKEKKELEYRLAYIQKLFPNINDIFDDNFNENQNFELKTIDQDKHFLDKKLRTVEKDYSTKISELKEENQRLSDQIKTLTNTVTEYSTKNEELQCRIDNATRYYHDIKNISPFIDEFTKSQYLNAFQTSRIVSAMSEEKEKPRHITVTAEIPSFSSSEIYHTSLTDCTCFDFQRHHAPCKHMLSLAVYMNVTGNMASEVIPILNQLSEKEKIILNEKSKLSKLREENKSLKKGIDEKTQTYPWLAEMISNYRTAKLDVRIKDPATKRELLSRIRCREKEIALLENRIAVLEYNFPILQEFREVSPQSLSQNLASSKDSGFVYEWLSEEEYQTLTSEEKQQRWINRYFQGKSRNAWESGIKYERYIGYLCEKEGYSVKYSGALLKLDDMGRDLIVSKGKHVYIIQCKRYSEGKEIHENSIFQLFGSISHYRSECPDKTVVGVFVTTTTLSEVARDGANKLGISVYENVEFKTYPAVKCHVSKSGEKIYHLPFDQQYDTTIINESRGDQYTDTVAEAVALGFRHAYRHVMIS